MAVQGEINKTDILKALDVIKTLCYKHKDCSTCPLRTHDTKDVYDTPDCYLYCGKTPPSTWDLNFADNWRAFRDTED